MARFALCIGINDYPGTDMELAGCVNDAQDWADELRGRGFAARTLLDAEATKAAMVASMRDTIAQGRDGDLVVITFSGHGTYVFDSADDGSRGDEGDGFDEALCPHDVQATGEPLLDDELHALFAARRPGVRLLLVADSCHSGTVSRDAVRPGAPRKRFLPPTAWRKPAAARATPAAWPARNFARTASSAFAPALQPAAADTAPLDDVLLAGCMEGKRNFSYDALIDNRANGAFTHFALKALRALPAGATYADWHAAITPRLLPTEDFPQAPQLVAIDAARQRRVLE